MTTSLIYMDERSFFQMLNNDNLALIGPFKLGTKQALIFGYGWPKTMQWTQVDHVYI